MSTNKDFTDTVTILADKPEYHQTIATNPLTKRELAVLQLLVEGCSDRSIALRLAITLGTAKTHVRRILYKLGTDRRTTAAVRALRCGLIK